MYVVSVGISRSGLSFRSTIRFIEPVFLMMCIFTCTCWLGPKESIEWFEGKLSNRGEFARD